MKKRILKWMVIPAVSIGFLIAFTACEDKEENTDKGQKASIEFCECYKQNTEKTCLEKLKDKYSRYEYESDVFIDAFNEANTCGIKLFMQYTKNIKSPAVKKK